MQKIKTKVISVVTTALRAAIPQLEKRLQEIPEAIINLYSEQRIDRKK